MGRLVVALAAALAGMPAAAHAALPYRVAVVPGGVPVGALTDTEVPVAVGLVVPDAGPVTSEARARGALERGEVVNSLRGEAPASARLVRIEPASLVPLRRARGTLFVGIPAGGVQPNDRRYTIALVGRSGLLTSESTRMPGLVAIGDIARGRLRVEPYADPAAYLLDLDRRIRDNARTRARGTSPPAVAAAVLAIVAPLGALLGLISFLLVNLALGVGGVSEPAVTIPALVLAIVAGWPLELGIRRLPASRRALLVGAAGVAVVGAYLVAMAVDGGWVALAPFGATQNSRFYGLSNTIETVLVAPVLAAAYVLGRRLGWPAFVLVAALTLVTVAGSRFGADGGGAVVFAAGLAVLAAGLASGGRRAVLLGAAVALLAVAAVALDALAGPATHVGETVRGGPVELAHDLAARLRVSWRRATDTLQLAVTVGVSIGALVVLALRGPRRPLPLAVAAAIAVSLLVNDSPKEVAGGGLIAYLAVSRLERREPGWAGSRGYTFRIPLRRLRAR